jgi:hypothetical protein
MSKHIDVTELILRDAHRSLMATRMSIEDLIPACGDLDQAGLWFAECWGGATYDSCIRFLNEDPGGRLRKFRKRMQTARLQMLLRGQRALPEAAELPENLRSGSRGFRIGDTCAATASRAIGSAVVSSRAGLGGTVGGCTQGQWSSGRRESMPESGARHRGARRRSDWANPAGG